MGWPPQFVQEFVCSEFSVPVTNILNSLFCECIVPMQLKDVVVIPVLKPPSPCIDKLCLVSLTPVLAKVVSGFISNGILECNGDKIDKCQFGHIKGVSTCHFLINLMHYPF